MAATVAPVGTEVVEETVAPVVQVMAATAAMAGAGVTEEMAETVVPAEKGGKEAKEAPVDMMDATARMAESLRGQRY